MPYVLYVIVVFERFKQKTHLLICSSSSEVVYVGNLLCFSGNYGITHICGAFAAFSTSLGSVVISWRPQAEVNSAQLQGVFHSLIFVQWCLLVIKNDNAL